MKPSRTGGFWNETESDGRLLEAMMELPEKLKTVLYLHYIEGYQVREISGFLRCSEAAVKKRLQRGRESLRESLSDGEEQEKCI